MRHFAVVVVIAVAFVSVLAATDGAHDDGGEGASDFASVERAVIESAR